MIPSAYRLLMFQGIEEHPGDLLAGIDAGLQYVDEHGGIVHRVECLTAGCGRQSEPHSSFCRDCNLPYDSAIAHLDEQMRDDMSASERASDGFF